MAETAALVPVPFFAPDRTGTGSFFDFRKSSTRPLRLGWQARTVMPGDGITYGRDSGVIGDTLIGTIVDIYA